MLEVRQSKFILFFIECRSTKVDKHLGQYFDG